MKTLFASILVVAMAGVAFAQEPPPPPAPPPPPGTPAPAPTTAPAPYPNAPAPYPNAPAPYPNAPGPSYYAPQPPQQQVYAPPPAASLRNGLTFEANIGFGWMRIADDNDSDTSDLTLGGLDLGVGGWVNPRLAIGVRAAGVTYSENGGRLTNAVLVGGLQYWANDNFWIGGGLGLGVLAASSDGDSDSISGFGMDLRAGYTFATTSENTFNVSFELTPTFLSEDGDSATVTGIALLLGYQHL
jgi:hypothetical protein